MFNLPAVVQEVMGEIIADIPKDAATEYRRGRVPVVIEDCVCQLPERSSQKHEQCRWHNKTILIHREIVVDTMKQEVQSKTDTVVRKPVVNVEEESVHQILDESPETHAASEVGGSSSGATQTGSSHSNSVGNTWQPDTWHDIPRGLAERLQEVAEQRSGLPSPVVTGPMNLLQVELFGEVAVPQLHQKWLVQVQELVGFIVLAIVGVHRQILLPRHSSGCVNGTRFGFSHCHCLGDSCC